MEICVNLGLPIAVVPYLYQSNVYIKSSYNQGEPKNVNLESVQNAHRPIRGRKLSGFVKRRIRPKMEICENSGLPIATVPCLHQSNVHIKRKL